MDTNETKTEQPNTEDLYKAIGDVIDEALAEYDELVKNDDKLAKMGQGIDYATPIDDKKGDGPKAKSLDGSTSEGTGAADNSGAGAMKKEDEDEKDKDKDKKKDKDDDEELMRSYKALVSKMEEKGLFAKTIQKSETAPKAEPKTEIVDSLRKSYDEKFETFQKALGSISESVKKIAAQPAAPRRGLTGQKPLRKSEGEGAPNLKKSEVVERLLDLKKSGDARVKDMGVDFSTLVNRVETNRLRETDVSNIKRILGQN